MLSLFLPQGTTIEYTGQGQPAFNAGSITVIVVPLTSIGDQLRMECSRLGLSAVVGGQVVWSPIGVFSNINFQLGGTGGYEEGIIEEATHPDLLGRVSFL